MSGVATNERRKAGFILATFFVIEGVFVLPGLISRPGATLARLGLAPGHHEATLSGWLLGIIVTALYVRHSCTLPSVRENLLRFSGLKILALGVALVAGILEEYFFRGMVMDWLLQGGWGDVVQVLVSALTFGVPHGIWALFRGSFRGGIGAIIATSILGGMLAIVYVVSNRSLGPCVASHFWINALAEPGLVLAAVRGEMGRRNRPIAESL